MGKISEIISVTLNVQDQQPAYNVFGVPLIASRFDGDDNTVLKNGIDFSELVRVYNSFDAIQNDFLSTSEQYKAGFVAFTQDRKPNQIAFGRIPAGGEILGGLANIDAENSKWYGLGLLSRETQDIVDASQYTETKRRIFLGQSSDSGILTAGNTDIAYQLKQNIRHRTALVYHPDNTQYIDIAALALGLTYAPGITTFARKQLANVTTAEISDTQRSNLFGKNCNLYEEIIDEGDFREGTMASGRYIDITMSADFIQASLEQRLYSLLKTNPKIPFTDGGIGRVRAVIDKFLSECVKANIIASDPAYIVYAPKAVDVPDADRARRKLTQVSFIARLAGAIQAIYIEGSLTI